VIGGTGNFVHDARGSVGDERESSFLTTAADEGAWAAPVVRGRCSAGRRCRRARSCVRVYMVQATRETEFGALQPCTTHTHTPTRLLSILWRASFACNIYTHTHTHIHTPTYTRARASMVLCLVLGFYYFFFHRKLSLFSFSNKYSGPPFTAQVQ